MEIKQVMPPQGTERPAMSERSVKAVRRLTILAMCVAFGMMALGAVVLWEAREDAWQQAERASANLVTTLERDIARNLISYDLSIQGALEALQQPGIESVSAELRQAAIFDRAASAEYLGSLLILDADGRVVGDSTSLAPHQLNLSDRDYFQAHLERADAGLFVSRPFRSRLRGGDLSMAISRRRSGPNGEFEGIVVGSLRLAYFQDMFAALDLGQGGSVFLVRDDGRMVARFPDRPPVADVDHSAASAVKLILGSRSGSFTATSTIDGIERLYTFRQIGALPLRVAVGLSTQDVLAPWWRKTVTIGVILSALASGTMALCLLFRREMARRQVAEAAVRQAADRLAVAASTDHLTGLANRRAFQAELDLAWRRAARDGGSLALLMADADCFKMYNDRFGHQEGDRVLQAVAKCLTDQARRPGDLAARHGGEEFVVLLPGNEVDGATQVADAIRTQLAAQAIEHPESPAGVVTISVGVAVAWPLPRTGPADLLRAADNALYAAKRAGRNRVCIGGLTESVAEPAPEAASIAAH